MTNMAVTDEGEGGRLDPWVADGTGAQGGANGEFSGNPNNPNDLSNKIVILESTKTPEEKAADDAFLEEFFQKEVDNPQT